MAVTNELVWMWKEAIVLIFCLMDHQSTPKHDSSRIKKTGFEYACWKVTQTRDVRNCRLPSDTSISACDVFDRILADTDGVPRFIQANRGDSARAIVGSPLRYSACASPVLIRAKLRSLKTNCSVCMKSIKGKYNGDAGTASVVYWSEFLATDPEVPGSIPNPTRLSEK
jgi:hypothetical protein